MPVKMIAVGRYYDRERGKEYDNGASFTVADDQAADRLVKARKAKRDTIAPAAAKAAVKTKVMKAEEPTPEPTPVVAAPEPDAQPVGFSSDYQTVELSRRNRYRRNDMRSED